MSMKAVIFDLDDTLYPEESYCLSGFRAAASYAEEKGMAPLGASEAYRELSELFYADHKNVFNRFLAARGIPDNRTNVMELVDIYRNHLPNISYYEDVKPVLTILRKKGIKTGILSDGYAEAQRKKIEALKAVEDFDIIILTDEFGKDVWKPSPYGFNVIAKYFKLEPEDMVYVGDNPEKDFYLKETAGIKTVRIMRENGVYINSPYYRDVREDYRIESLTELEDLI